MSLVLSTRLTSSPRVQQLVEQLGIPLFANNGVPLLVSPQWQREDQSFEDELRFFFYIPYESTRAIEVWYSEGWFRVCIMPLSTDLELELAVRFLESCRSLGATTVEDNSESIPIESLREKYSPDFNNAFNQSALRDLIVTLKGTNNLVLLQGPIREFAFGPLLASRLLSIKDEQERLKKVYDMMRALQFWSVRDDFRECAEPDGESFWDGSRRIEIKPDVSYVVPKADEIQWIHDGTLHTVNAKGFIERGAKELSPDKFLLMDEYSFKLKLNAGDLENLIASYSRSQLRSAEEPKINRAEPVKATSISELVDHLVRKARRESLTGEEFNKTVEKAEKLYEYDPKVYKAVVAGLAALGYGYILFFVYLALYGIFTFGPQVAGYSGINYWALILLVVSLLLAMIMFKSLFVEFSPPSGLKLDPADAPGFFKMLENLRSKLGVQIDEVWLNFDFNACVIQNPRLGMLGWHKNYLVVGLPLLISMTSERATSILSHELGHISGSHGKFSAWIYGLIESWTTLLVEVSKRSQIGFITFYPLYCWYLPRFKAYAQVLNRQHEHEADQMATLVTNRMANAESLIAVHILAKYLESKFWRSIYELNLRSDAPPDDIFGDLARDLKSPHLTEQEAQEWYAQALLTETGPQDTHPSLSDRLLAIGYPARDLQQLKSTRMQLLSMLTLQDSAAQAFLGPRAGTLTRQLSTAWRELARENWQLEYQIACEQKKHLSELEQKRTEGRLEDDDQLVIGALVEKFNGARAALPIYNSYLESKPRDGKAAFYLGRALLDLNIEDGIGYLEQAMNRDSRYIAEGCALACDYYERQNKQEISKEYRRRLASHKMSAVLAYEERETISEEEVFLSHDLSPAILNQIQTRLIECKVIQSAFLAKRRLKHLSDIPQYVLGVERHFVMTASRGEILEFLCLLQASFVDLDIHITMIDLTEFNRNLRGNFARVSNCQIFPASTKLSDK